MKHLIPYAFGVNELSEKAFDFYSNCSLYFFIDEEGYYMSDNKAGTDAWFIGSNRYEVNDFLEDL